MRPFNRLFIVLTLTFGLLSCTRIQSTRNSDLVDFSSISSEKMQSANANLQIIEQNGQQVLSVQSKDDPQANVVVSSSKDSPWQLDNTHQVKAEITNLGAHKTQVNMYVGLDPDPLMRWYCSDFVELNPGETKTVSVDLTWLPWVHSPQLEFENMRGEPGREKTPREAVQQVSFGVRYPTRQNHYAVNRIYAEGRTEVRDTTGFFPFVDRFGQFRHEDWPDKIHNLDELKAVSQAERKSLESEPDRTDVDAYGGWSEGPRQEASGYFYPKKVDGKWWLVTPSGNLFWSAGVNCVSNESVYTNVTGREQYFEGLPEKSDETTPFFGTRRNRQDHSSRLTTFNHYSHNLYQIFGEDYLDSYREVTLQRFQSWGLNTIGFVSDKDLAARQKMPYVGSVWIRGTRKIEGSDGYWGKFHDVFDENFRPIVKEAVESQKFGANDPWCIGYFVDNELSWGAAGSLSIAALKSPADQPAKKVFVEDLKAKYGQIGKLNDVWKTEYLSWEDMLNSTSVPDENNARVDLDDFYRKIARTYFKIVNDELKRVAPYQNYMGCRLAWAQNEITLGAAAEFCDILSFNKYEFSVESVDLPEGLDKPILIGEFHFGALGRGMLHVGVKRAENHADRGQKYQEYVQSALRNEYIIGAHWFQYIDEPISGRGDGENYSVGLVNVCNRPYPELVGKISETCHEMYRYRSDL